MSYVIGFILSWAFASGLYILCKYAKGEKAQKFFDAMFSVPFYIFKYTMIILGTPFSFIWHIVQYLVRPLNEEQWESIEVGCRYKISRNIYLVINNKSKNVASSVFFARVEI